MDIVDQMGGTSCKGTRHPQMLSTNLNYALTKKPKQFKGSRAGTFQQRAITVGPRQPGLSIQDEAQQKMRKSFLANRKKKEKQAHQNQSQPTHLEDQPMSPQASVDTALGKGSILSFKQMTVII